MTVIHVPPQNVSIQVDEPIENIVIFLLSLPNVRVMAHRSDQMMISIQIESIPAPFLIVRFDELYEKGSGPSGRL